MSSSLVKTHSLPTACSNCRRAPAQSRLPTPGGIAIDYSLLAAGGEPSTRVLWVRILTILRRDVQYLFGGDKCRLSMSRIPPMDLRHLRAFVAAAEERSFTKASQRLHISRPPLSRYIRQLEDELDLTLFVRSRNGVELTAEGRVLFEKALSLLRRLRELQAFFLPQRQNREQEDDSPFYCARKSPVAGPPVRGIRLAGRQSSKGRLAARIGERSGESA